MGYFTNTNIADVVENKKITLAHNPNFVIFKNKNSTKVPVAISLFVSTTYAGGDEYPEATEFSIVENSTGIKHTFRGTNKKENLNSNTFLLNSLQSITAENIRIAFMKDSWLKNNFEITIPFSINGTNIKNGNTIYITSKGAGEQFTFTFEKLNSSFLTLSGNPSQSSNSDSIDGGKGKTEIELELYTDTNCFLGVKDLPTEADFGTYTTTLSKHYFQDELWFETNNLLSKKVNYKTDFLTSSDWVDTGTYTDYRYIAKTFDGETRTPFYISNVLYVLNGYDYTLNENDLTDYVYDTLYPTVVQPLTNAPDKNYVIGQTEYFNFILSDMQHNINISPEFNFGLTYKYYTPSGDYITTVNKQNKNRKKMYVVNTIQLNPDIETIEKNFNKTVGSFTVALNKDNTPISKELKYNVVPECLNRTNEFVFLNKLGGWDSFNFGGVWSTEFKTDASTIYKTLLPDYKISSEIESVFKKEVEEQFSIKSDIVDYETVEWLRELAASKVVYELYSLKYVIVDDLTLKYNDDDDNYQVEMKYHFSDNFNGVIKG
jgi:hypothetical protein